MVSIPVLRTNASIQSDGSVSRLNLGGLLVFEGVPSVTSATPVVPWSSEGKLGKYIFGPIDAETNTGIRIAWRATSSWSGLSKTFYVAANRGRGQIYPDGNPSNISGWKIPTEAAAALSSGLCYQPKRYGSVVTLLTPRGMYLLSSRALLV